MPSERDKPSSTLHRVLDLDERDEAPVTRLCNLILSEALAHNSSAISLLSTGEGCSVRYQVGDEWHDVFKIPTVAGVPVINRIRVLANLDRTKGHTRQAGLLHARFHGNAILFKVEVEPRPDGMEDLMLHCRQ